MAQQPSDLELKVPHRYHLNVEEGGEKNLDL
jgi:hypothetical protein